MWRSIPSGVGVVLMRTGRVLALEQRDGRYSLPGGHVEDHEEPLDAAFRELFEETGLRIDVSGGVDRIMDYPIPFGGTVRYFRVHRVTGQVRASPEGRPVWLPVVELLGRARFPAAYKSVFNALRGDPRIR